MTVQLTIIRIEKYGAWTLTLGNDREAQIQMLQARIYYDLQKLFNNLNCIVYFNRFDEYFSITNGLSLNDHIFIHNKLKSKYDKLQISMTIGIGKTPLKANNNAHNARTNKSYLDKKYLIFGIRSSLKEKNKDFLDKQKEIIIKDNKISIIHVDVDSSKKINLEKTPFEMTCNIMEIYVNLIRQFLKYDGLTFYLGGDNFMVISKIMKKENVKDIIDSVSKKLNVNLNCGIGIGLNSRKAVECATNALDKIRRLRDKGNDEYIYEVTWLQL